MAIDIMVVMVGVVMTMVRVVVTMVMVASISQKIILLGRTKTGTTVNKVLT